MPLSVMAMLMAAAPAASRSYVTFKCDPETIVGTCASELGRYVDHRPGPRIDGRPTLLLSYEPSTSLDFHDEEVAILQKNGARYRVLWSHPTIYAWAMPPAVSGFPTYATVYKWSFDPKTRRITVTGTKTIGRILDMWTGMVVGRRRNLPREVYCYTANARFERCHAAPG
jgi:hypothetical protein